MHTSLLLRTVQNDYIKPPPSPHVKPAVEIEKIKSQEIHTRSCLTVELSPLNMEGHDHMGHSMPARGPMCNMNACSLLTLLIQSWQSC